MKVLKKLFPAVLAAGICLGSIQMVASADALLAEDAWWVGEWYVINSDGVYAYDYTYVFGEGSQEAQYSFSQGDTVYARQAVNRMGINWAACQRTNEHESAPGNVYYGFIDMAYLTPYDEYFAPEPETEAPTDPPTEPPTEAPTTKATTKATTKVTTALTTIKTTKRTTEKTQEETKAVFSVIDNEKNNKTENFLTNNFTLLLIGGVVVLLAASGALAVGLISYNKNKSSSENISSDVKYCSYCGTQHPKTAMFCRKCGKSFK